MIQRRYALFLLGRLNTGGAVTSHEERCHTCCSNIICAAELRAAVNEVHQRRGWLPTPGQILPPGVPPSLQCCPVHLTSINVWPSRCTCVVAKSST